MMSTPNFIKLRHTGHGMTKVHFLTKREQEAESQFAHNQRRYWLMTNSERNLCSESRRGNKQPADWVTGYSSIRPVTRLKVY
jgi:hypothetical protein